MVAPNVEEAVLLLLVLLLLCRIVAGAGGGGAFVVVVVDGWGCDVFEDGGVFRLAYGFLTMLLIARS